MFDECCQLPAIVQWFDLAFQAPPAIFEAHFPLVQLFHFFHEGLEGKQLLLVCSLQSLHFSFQFLVFVVH